MSETAQQYVGPLAAGFRFQHVAIRSHDLVYLGTFAPDMQEKGLPYAFFIGYDDFEFGRIGSVQWNCVSVCSPTVPKPQMVALGEYGQIKVFGSDDDCEERVTSEELEFREVRHIAGKAYACAMDRKVFRRDAPGQWTPIHGDMPGQPGPDIVVGLESIHGFSQDDLFAVGWHGEIWHGDGRRWTQETAPTRALLARVLCAPDAQVYACGLGGTLLRGTRGRWQQIAGSVNVDLWDLAWFGDRLWVASLSGLYTLQGDRLEPVAFEDDAPTTFSRLDARDGMLWSVGTHDIMQFDGNRWTRIAGE